jgi:hypothetical protein
LALASTTLLAGDVALAGDGGGPQATEAACGKKCLKRRARRFIRHHKFSRVLYNQVSGTSSTERYDFCGGGTFRFRGDYEGYGGTAWTDTFQGTWSVRRARRTSALVHFTTSNFQSIYFDGSQGPDSPPPSSGNMRVQAQSAAVVFLGGAEFSRGPGAC